MHKITVNMQTGEQIISELTEEEIAEAKEAADREAEFQLAWAKLNASVLRRTAYVAEADPLFFKWQAGESTEEEWKTKRDEIKARFPKE